MNEEQQKTPLSIPVPSSKSDFEPLHKDIYESYCLWKAIPAFLKNPPKDKDGSIPTAEEFCKRMGVEDPAILALVDIRNQTEFAERFGISYNTTTDWNKTVGVRDTMDDIRRWARGLSKNVLMALYNTAIRKGYALEVKLFFQLVEKWEEKQQVEHNYKGVAKIQYEIVPPKNDPNEHTKQNIGEAVSSVANPQG